MKKFFYTIFAEIVANTGKIADRLKKYKIQKIGVIILIVSIIFGHTLLVSAAENSYQDERKTRLENEILRIQKDVDTITLSLSQSSVQAKTLQQQRNQLQDEINKTEQLLTDTREILHMLEVDINQKQAVGDGLKKGLTKILRSIQTTEKTGFIEIIVTSGNIGEVLTKMRQLTEIASQTDTIRSQLAAVTKELESKKSDQQKAETILKEARSVLQSKKDSLDILISKTQNDEQMYQQLLAGLAQQDVEKNREIQLNEQQQKDGNTVGQNPLDRECVVNAETKPISVPTGYFIRPMEGRISQGFGCKNGQIHDGIDVAGGIGVPIYASAGGEVARKRIGCVNGGDPWCNGGLGNFVVLKHNLPSGDTVFTVYAHLTTIAAISESQRVSQGTLLGYNGCTGNTYPRPCGPHLHFSILSGTELGVINCNRMYGNTRTTCYDPSEPPFDIF